ncbi:unnamed protein product [Brassica oleracea var. botrytis]
MCLIQIRSLKQLCQKYSGDSLPPPPLSKSKQEGGNKWREPSSAIMRLGEAYELIENAKLRQVVEMEKERLSFFKDAVLCEDSVGVIAG